MKVKLHVLIRRIKRSFRNDREQWIKGGILAAILLVIVIFAGSLCMRQKEGEGAGCSVPGSNEDHPDSKPYSYCGTSSGK